MGSRASKNRKMKTEKLMSEKALHEFIVHGYIRSKVHQKYLINAVIKTIAKFYFFVTGNGSLYMFGNGRHGRLGIEKYKDKDSHTFELGGPFCKEPTLCLPFDQNNALDVALNVFHTLVLDISGSVWGCGLGRLGRMGNGQENKCNVLTKLNSVHSVVSISAGGHHSLLLCENGWVQSFGDNCWGQLGHDINLKKSLVPKTIEKLRNHEIVQICAGYNHSAALTKDGDLFCFGYNEYGQCGAGQEKEKYFDAPTKVQMDDKIVFVECGNNHSLLITRNDLFYSFGDGDHGKLGHGSKDNKYIPTLIDALKKRKIQTCAAGREHTICIDEKGMVWTFGLALCDEYRSPVMIEWFAENNVKAKYCYAGWEQSCVISGDECLYVFGNNEQYQLALQYQKIYYTPQKLSFSQSVRIQKVSMGRFHTAVIGIM